MVAPAKIEISARFTLNSFSRISSVVYRWTAGASIALTPTYDTQQSYCAIFGTTLLRNIPRHALVCNTCPCILEGNIKFTGSV